MLNVAITCLFVVICIFQPWMAVIFAFIWLLEIKYKHMESQRQVDRDKLLKNFDKKSNQILQELQSELDNISTEDEEKPKGKPNLRIVK